MKDKTQLTASQKRAAHPDFIPTFSLEALRPLLPFRFPVPENLPPSPKPRYRSWYRFRGFEALALVLLRDDPAWVIEQITRSNLRGRGVVGYPTGKKW